MKTTLNKIKSAKACEDRYEVLLKALGKTKADDEPLSIRYILESNGIEDAIWALKTIENHDKEIRLFACDCAEMALPIYEITYPNDNRPRRSIEVARLYANNEATKKQLAGVNTAARVAASAAARAAIKATIKDTTKTITRDATSAAAWAAAWAATKNAPNAAAWIVARDAAWAATNNTTRNVAWDKIKTILLKYI